MPSNAHKGGKGAGPPQGSKDQYTHYQDTRPLPNTMLYQTQSPTVESGLGAGESRLSLVVVPTALLSAVGAAYTEIHSQLEHQTKSDY